MAKPKPAETSKRTTPPQLTPRDIRDIAPVPLTEEALDSVVGGYIGETEKNLRRD